ncbi:MAG: division plane positioning ATPase MipZ [Acidimicrobiales bacterium]
MELVTYIRLLRRRWKVLVALTVIGALAGFGFSMLGEDEPRPEEIQTYYAANETLLVRSGDSVNLQQTAFFVTAGAVPDRALEILDTDDESVVDLVQTVYDNSTDTIVVSAAGSTPEEAFERTQAFADALLLQLQADRQTDYDAQVDAVESEIERRQASIVGFDEQLREKNDERVDLSVQLTVLEGQLEALGGAPLPAEGEAPPTVDTAAEELAQSIAQVEGQIAAIDSEIAVLNIQRESDFSALQSAFSTQETLVDQGAPLAPLEKLEVRDPYEISQGEFNERRRAGELGTASYGLGDAEIPRSSGGGGGVTQSLTDNPPLLIAGGGIVGLLLGVLLVILLSRLDYRIRTKEEAEEHFGLPVVAEIPAVAKEYRNSTEVLVQVEPMSRFAEAYRSLRSALVYARMMGETADHASSAAVDPVDEEEGERGLEVVMVASPGPGEGKTTTVANLAAALAEQGYQVLAVNCDYRRPRLVHFLQGSHSPREISETIIPGVSMINHVTAEGSDARPADALAAQRRVIERARGKFDVVLLDTAPLLATNDANELLPVVDLVLVVGQVGRTTKEMAEKARELLLRRGAPVIGLALVGVTDTVSAAGYYYYSSSAKGKGRKRGPTGETIARNVADGTGASADSDVSPTTAKANGDRAEEADADDGPGGGEGDAQTLEGAESSRWWRRGA